MSSTKPDTPTDTRPATQPSYPEDESMDPVGEPYPEQEPLAPEPGEAPPHPPFSPSTAWISPGWMRRSMRSLARQPG